LFRQIIMDETPILSLRKVIKMKGIKPEKAGSLARKLLRLIGADMGAQELINQQVHTHVSSSNTLLTNALLKSEEAQLYWHELRKAEALLYWQRWLNRPA